MSIREILGEKLRSLRQQKGLTQRQISQVLGYANDTYVSDVERGAFVPHPDKLRWSSFRGHFFKAPAAPANAPRTSSD